MEKEGSGTDTQIRIRKAGYADVNDIKKLLARAFDNDPLQNWYVVQDEKRTSRLEKFVGTYLEHYAMKYNHAFATEELTGAAIWFPPEPANCWKSSILKELSLMHKFIPVMGIRKLPAIMAGIELLQKHHLKKAHFYLPYIGVDPVSQGKGIGSQLLLQGLGMCNQKRVPAYLETSVEKNLSYYEKHDFSVMAEVQLNKGPKVWTMIYEPK
jgi:ribosomal protein S18 acetylase RimI-like enzyme